MLSCAPSSVRYLDEAVIAAGDVAGADLGPQCHQVVLGRALVGDDEHLDVP
jgi:hypothetical protein